VGTIRTHGQRSRCLTQMRTRAAPARPTPPARRRASQTGTRCHLRRGTPPAPAPRVNICHPILHQSLQALALSSCQHQRGLCIERFATPARAKGKGGNKRWATHLKDAEGVVWNGEAAILPCSHPTSPHPATHHIQKAQWRHTQGRKGKQRHSGDTSKDTSKEEKASKEARPKQRSASHSQRHSIRHMPCRHAQYTGPVGVRHTRIKRSNQTKLPGASERG
jgi:hypothetical protein